MKEDKKLIESPGRLSYLVPNASEQAGFTFPPSLQRGDDNERDSNDKRRQQEPLINSSSSSCLPLCRVEAEAAVVTAAVGPGAC